MNDTADLRASFTRMSDGTPKEWALIHRREEAYIAGRVPRLISHLKLLEGDSLGYAIDRLAHSLQSATRAQKDGRDEEYIVCALLHDIGDTLAVANHSDLAATILEPYVSEENHWIVKHHGILQGYHYFGHVGLDRNMRDRYRDHPHYEACAEFCELYDQNCFDPKFQNLPLGFFEPMVERKLAKPRRSIYLPEAEWRRD